MDAIFFEAHLYHAQFIRPALHKKPGTHTDYLLTTEENTYLKVAQHVAQHQKVIGGCMFIRRRGEKMMGFLELVRGLLESLCKTQGTFACTVAFLRPNIR